MALLLAVAMVLVSMDASDEPIPPPYAPPAEEIQAPDPEPLEPKPLVAPEPVPAPLVASRSPHSYLYAAYPGLARRLDCMIQRESAWDPGAVSPGGRYVGLAQFDYPTWMSTPQGRAGASRYEPYASIDAMAWGTQHLGWGRWPVTSRLC